MIRDWVKIASWHAVRTPTRMFNTYITLCGKRATGEVFDLRPQGKSCETCLRILDAAETWPEDDESTWPES